MAKTLATQFREYSKTANAKALAAQLGVKPAQIKRWSGDDVEIPSETLVAFFNDVIGSKVASNGTAQPVVATVKQDDGFEKIDEVAEKALGKVYLAFPTGKQTNPVTAWILAWVGKTFGKQVVMDMELGDMMIYNSRNKLAGRFMASNCDKLVMLDDDMIPPIGRGTWFKAMCGLPEKYAIERAEVNFLQRITSHKQSVVGALYFGRHAKGAPMFKEGLTDVFAAHAARDGTNNLIPTDWVGTGCIRIDRQVFMDIQQKFPNLAPEGSNTDWDYFQPNNKGKKGGEDVAFCQRAKEAGHQVYVDLGLECMHVGWCAWGSHNTTGGASA